MIELGDTIEIRTTPERIFAGLVTVFSSEEHFRKWHKDHVKCQWLKGRPFEIGSVLYVEEYLYGSLRKMKFLGTKVEPDRRIEYRLLFPTSILCPRGSFTVESKGDSCHFTAVLHIRAGWLFSILAGGRIEAIKKHMREEGENLKELLEKGEI